MTGVNTVQDSAGVCSNARAGWLGAMSYDSDKAPHPRGPRKDTALAGLEPKVHSLRVAG